MKKKAGALHRAQKKSKRKKKSKKENLFNAHYISTLKV